MRSLKADIITDMVREMCIEANYVLPKDMQEVLYKAKKAETDELPCYIMDIICENFELAQNERLPICQDTGAASVFLEIGQDLHIDGDIEDAINEGVRRGYTDGYLRASIVRDPLKRENTKDNTPAFITYAFTKGDKLKITVMPKGFGSENMSAMKMLTPSSGVEGVCDFIEETVKKAGSNPCPPIVVGVGIGGSFDKVTLLAKKALLRTVDSVHEDEFYRELEEKLLERLNKLNIGPQGFGGKTSVLKVNIMTAPTHIAALPVAVSINCHVNRRITREV